MDDKYNDKPQENGAIFVFLLMNIYLRILESLSNTEQFKLELVQRSDPRRLAPLYVWEGYTKIQ